MPADAIKAIQDGRPVTHLDGVIRAPVAGTVVEKLITPGQLLQAGSTPCFTVADLSRVWVLAQVFGTDLTAVRVGDSAEIVTGIGQNTFSGTVDNIAALVDPDTRSVAVRVVAKNPADFLKKQMYVRVLIHAQKPSTGTLIPVSAVLRDDVNLPFVYAVWAGKRGIFGGELSQKLHLAKANGLAHVQEIVQDTTEATAEFRRDYLTRYIRFDLGAAEKEAVVKFQQHAFEMGLISARHDLRYIT